MFAVNFVHFLDIFYVVDGDSLIFWNISTMILVLMRKLCICRCRSFFQTIVELCIFFYCTVTFILSYHCKYIKPKQLKKYTYFFFFCNCLSMEVINERYKKFKFNTITIFYTTKTPALQFNFFHKWKNHPSPPSVK